MTAITSVLGKYGISTTLDDAPIAIGSWMWNGAKKLVGNFSSYDTTTQTSENPKGFRYGGTYNGIPVYTGSNEEIGRLLDKCGAPGHKSKKMNYGAAFDGAIYLNDTLNPQVREYVLRHEEAHIRHGANESEAHKYAETKTGITIAQIGGFI